MLHASFLSVIPDCTCPSISSAARGLILAGRISRAYTWCVSACPLTQGTLMLMTIIFCRSGQSWLTSMRSLTEHFTHEPGASIAQLSCPAHTEHPRGTWEQHLHKLLPQRKLLWPRPRPPRQHSSSNSFSLLQHWPLPKWYQHRSKWLLVLALVPLQPHQQRQWAVRHTLSPPLCSWKEGLLEREIAKLLPESPVHIPMIPMVACLMKIIKGSKYAGDWTALAGIKQCLEGLSKIRAS